MCSHVFFGDNSVIMTSTSDPPSDLETPLSISFLAITTWTCSTSNSDSRGVSSPFSKSFSRSFLPPVHDVILYLVAQALNLGIILDGSCLMVTHIPGFVKSSLPPLEFLPSLLCLQCENLHVDSKLLTQPSFCISLALFQSARLPRGCQEVSPKT